MTNWTTEPLENCLDVLLDYRGKSPTKSETGIPVLSARVVKTAGLLRPIEQTISPEYYPKWMTRGFPQPGDVVMTTEAPLGEIIQLDNETATFALGQRLVCLRGKSNKLDNTFLRYLLTSPGQQEILASRATGTTVLGISQKSLRSMPISFPGYSEQENIGGVLASLDAKIELNRKMNETLEAMARALFRDWFVDFGPTRARMEGTAPYLSPDLWSLFPDSLDDQGKPEGWEVCSLNHYATLNPESWTARNAPQQVAYVDLANTKWGNIDRIEYYKWVDAPSRARRILRAGDTIVGTVRPGNGSFGYIGEDGLTGSTGFAVLRPKNQRDRIFVWCAATSAENIDRLTHLADGGAYPAVRPDAVVATETVIPSTKELDAFCHALSGNVDLMEANRAESRTLAQTRDLLLPRLMSGELRMAEAERTVEAVL